MIRDRMRIKGKVVASVLDSAGNLKKRTKKLTFLEELSVFFATLGHKADRLLVREYQIAINHNIVTDMGDALIADIVSSTDARTAVDNANGVIEVGTGWTGTNPKQNTGVNTGTGSPEPMDATYPKLKGAWGLANDNVIQYRATFEAGDLNAADIDEAALGNGVDNMAYAQVTPSATVGSSDTLQVDWEITFVGS